MGKVILALAPDLTVIGNLNGVTWDSCSRMSERMEFELYILELGERIRDLGLEWQQFICEPLAGLMGQLLPEELRQHRENPDPVTRLLIGDSRRSRKVAVHRDDPRGIIYVLEDDNQDWLVSQFPDVLKPITVVKALAFHELIREGLPGAERHLELDAHRNERLVPWEQRTSLEM